jgi:chromosome segregation ATPase
MEEANWRQLREYWWIDDLLREEIKMLYEIWQKEQEELTDEIEKLKEELEKWDKNYDELEERYKRMDKIYKEVCEKLEDILKRRPDTKQLD